MMSLAWSPVRVRDAWRAPLATVLALLLLILLVYHETAAAMVVIWMRSGTFTHAFVVPPIVAWLVWRQRATLEALQPRPMPWLLLPLAGLAVLWWVGHLVNVAAAMQLALVGMLVASVPLVLGWPVARALAFPLAFTFFAVPIGEFLTPTLMHWTVDALVLGLRATGIPVYQEGQQLVIPSGRWAVVAACSGIRYLMATFMVGSLFAYLNYNSLRKRLVFVAISLVLPVIANWVRAYIIVMLGHLSNNEIATGVDHLVYGWVFFGVVIMALFFIGARWSDPELTQPSVSDLDARWLRTQGDPGHPAWRPFAVVGMAVLVAFWPMLAQRHDVAPHSTAPVQLTLPPAIGTWTARELPPGSYAPFFETATKTLARSYQGPQGDVAVHVSYYRGQVGDVKLVTSVNAFVNGSPWHVLSEGVASTPVDGQDITWRQAVLLATAPDAGTGGPQPRLTVWRLYWLGGPTSHRDIQAKLIQAWQAVRGEPDDGAAIHLVSSLAEPAAAQRQLSAFVAENYSALVQTLARTRESR